MFDSPPNDQSKVKSQKIIHNPSEWELEHLAEFLSGIGIGGADRVLLIWGRKIFDEDWISYQTKNWLTVFEDDLEKYEDATDDQNQRIFAIMAELDYKALRGSLHMDAMYATAKMDDAEWEKSK